MEATTLRRTIDESHVVHTFVAVHRVKRITQDQLSDIFSISPNYLPFIVERTNQFLEKMSHLITMAKLQVECDDPKFAKTHPDAVHAVEEYFINEDMDTNTFTKDMVDASILFYTIGKFCIGTEEFFKEIEGPKGKTREEILEHILLTVDEDIQEYAEDETTSNRYALRYFTKLLEKKKGILPKGVTNEDVLAYIKGYIYKED
jgi:hypothetical protein